MTEQKLSKLNLFIQKLKNKGIIEKYNYDYSKVSYINNATKVIVICPIHGDFEITPGYHLQGGYCKMCAKENVANYWTPERRKQQSERIKSDEVLAKRRKTNKDKYGSDSWVGSDNARIMKENDEGPWSKKSRAKAMNTNIEKYGSKTWAESDTGKEKLVEILGSDNMRKKMSDGIKSDTARAKYIATSLKNHGAKHWTQSTEGKEYLKYIFNTPEERQLRSERMLSSDVKRKYNETSMERYGVPYYWQSDEARARLKQILSADEVVAKTKATNMIRYGSELWQTSDVGKLVLKEKANSDEVRSKYKATCNRLYSSDNWSTSDVGLAVLRSKEHIDKIVNTKKSNGTMNTSKPEQLLGKMLVNYFGQDDVMTQHRLDKRYPFNCDFYIKSLDLFIELNATWLHGGKWFDPESDEDLTKVDYLKSKHTPLYDRYVDIWTGSDVTKRNMARANNLNYVVLWDCNLNDAKRWISDGCPIRHDWK